MSRSAFCSLKRRAFLSVALTVLACMPGLASAQTLGVPIGALPPAPETINDPLLTPASCTSCGVSGTGPAPYLPISPGCGVCNGQGCVPGRTNDCSACGHGCPDNCVGRLFCGLYQGICCPDPCYEPRWVAAAESGFFIDAARPVTHTRIRWEAINGYRFPDRSEFFWARSGGGGRGPANPETNLRNHDLSLYTEAATGKAGIFVEIPYRSLDPDVNNHAAGFADMNVGTKAMLFDTELLEVTFQFRTYIPIAPPGKGLGTGHVSLEPSLLASLKLCQDTYLQSQLSEWIPLGGDPSYMGSILHYHFSLNTVICRILPDCPLIGTVNLTGYSFQDGQYTDPFIGQFQQSSGETYLSAGPGLRLIICDKIDFGVAGNLAIGDHGPNRVYRTEFRWRF